MIKNSNGNKAQSALLKKGLSILLCFPNQSQPLSQSDIAQKTGLPMSTTARLMQALVEMDFLERDERTKLFELGVRCYQLGVTAKYSGDLRRVALPVMQKLFDRFNETVTLYKRSGDMRVCYEQIVTSHRLKQSAYIGDEVPLWVASPGRCIMAYMDDTDIDRILANIRPYTSKTILDRDEVKNLLIEVRKTRHAISISERDEGVASVSSPILDGNANAVGCVTLSGPEVRFSSGRIGEMIPAVIAAAQQITEDLKEWKKER